jgi:hypothetical protein
MKRSFTRAVSVLAIATAATLSLSACGSDSKARDASVEELANRGFKDVKFMKDVGSFGSTMLFTGQVGTCRLEISRTENGRYQYWTLPNLSEQQQKAIEEKAGGRVVDTVNASFIEKYGADIGIGYCVSNAAS